MNEFELGWVVGFLEGEGSFWGGPSRRAGRPGQAQWEIRVEAHQVQREPLDRILRYVGVGKLSGPREDRRRPTYSPIYSWRVTGHKARDLMMVLRPHLSPKRQVQVDDALRKFAARPRRDYYASTKNARAVIQLRRHGDNDPRQLKIGQQ